MSLLRLASAVLLSSLALSALAVTPGCAAEADDDDAIGNSGDSVGGEDEIISEHQLMGGELPPKTIALTFDDGPGPRTAELAEYLATKGIPAAFFINGSKVAGRQGTLDTILGRGHLLANHTQNHLQLTRLSSDKVVTELAQTDAIIAAAQPGTTFLMRAPFGAMNGGVVRALNGSPMKKYVGSVFWDIGGQLTQSAAADWDCWGKRVTVARCGDLYVQEITARRRGIVLLHDIHGSTVDMVKQIVPRLQADGYKFAKLTDVPSVARAIAAASGGAVNEGGCASSSLGRHVAEKTCVQSRRDSKWYVCTSGDWLGIASASDARCAEKFPLP
jgi:peptidoglycan/xylan/chitin deacetylase (PgdA/CDA1 family)